MELMHLRKQILTEANYRYSFKLDRGGMAYFGKAKGVAPNTMVIPLDNKDLKETENIAVVSINNAAGNKMWKDAISTGQMGRYSEEADEFISLWQMSRSTNFDSFLGLMDSYPNIFKINTIQGRDNIFKHLTTDYGMPPSMFQKHLGDPPELSDEHFTDFHGARVFVPENARAATKKSMITVLETLFQHLKANGFGFLFHGDIRFIKINGTAVGLYQPATKTMAIKPSAKVNKDVIYTLLHEFAHKYWYEYMSENARNMVRAKYKTLRQHRVGHVRDTEARDASIAEITAHLEPGVEFEYLGRKKSFKMYKHFVIKDVDENGNWTAYRKGDPNETHIVGGPPGVFLKKQWDLEGLDVNRDVATERYDAVSDQWFPTNYSQTDAEEWWAELTTFFMLDHLKGEPDEFMHEVFEA